MSSLPEAGQEIQDVLKDLKRERAELMREMKGVFPQDLPKQLGVVCQPRKRFVRGSARTALRQELQEYLGLEITGEAPQGFPSLSDPERRRFEPHELFPPFEIPEGEFPPTETEEAHAEREQAVRERQRREMAGKGITYTVDSPKRWIHPRERAEAEAARYNDVLEKLRIKKPDDISVFHTGMTFTDVEQARRYVESAVQERWGDHIARIETLNQQISETEKRMQRERQDKAQHPLGTLGDKFGGLFRK